MLAFLLALVLNAMPATTPYLVQLGDVKAAGIALDGNGGPYQRGTDAFAAVTTIDLVASGSQSISIYQSTDSQNWTEQDLANAPSSANNNAPFASSFYPKAGGDTLYVADNDPPNPIPLVGVLNLHSFSMATAKWTLIAGGGPSADNFLTNPQFLLVRRSTGEFILAYMARDGGGKRQVYYVSYNGGWGAPVLVSSGYANGDSAHPALIGIDAADRVYILWYSFDSGTSATGNLYGTILTGGVLSGASLIISQATINQYWEPQKFNFAVGWNTQGKYVTRLNQVAWALPFWNVGGNPGIVPTLVIADCATGTFSTATVHSYSLADSNEQDQFWIDFAPNAAETILRTAWTRNTPGDGNLAVYSDSTTTLAGPSWGAPATYYNEATNPPVPAQAANGTNSISARFLTGGFSALIGLFSFQNGGSFQQAQFGLVDTTQAATPAVVNPGPAGRKPVPLHPNQFDFCLHRENRLYCAIDVARLMCANIPECFSVDEREWGAAS